MTTSLYNRRNYQLSPQYGIALAVSIRTNLYSDIEKWQ